MNANVELLLILLIMALFLSVAIWAGHKIFEEAREYRENRGTDRKPDGAAKVVYIHPTDERRRSS